MTPPCRILLVDDDPGFVTEITLFLEHAGYEVKSLLHPGRLLFFLPRFEPQLLLLDLELPDTDGIEVLRRVRNSSWGEKLPAVLITGCGSQSALEEGFESGLDEYIAKPFSPKELLLRLQALLRRSNRRPDFRKARDFLPLSLRPASDASAFAEGRASGILLWREGFSLLASSSAPELGPPMQALSERWVHGFRDRLLARLHPLRAAELPVLELSEDCLFLPLPESFPRLLWLDELQRQALLLKRAWKRTLGRFSGVSILVSDGQTLHSRALPAFFLRWLSFPAFWESEVLQKALELGLSLDPKDDLVRSLEF